MFVTKLRKSVRKREGKEMRTKERGKEKNRIM